MLFFLLLCTSFASLNFINVYIGTSNSKLESHGNVYPSIATPFAMHSITFQNLPLDDSWIFNYPPSSIQGLRLTHQPSPWMGDYNYFMITPSLSSNNNSFNGTVVSANPSEALLLFDGIWTSVTSLQTVFVTKFTTDKTFFLHINTISGISNLTQVDDKQINGMIRNGEAPNEFPLYVTLLFSNPILSFDCYSNNLLVKNGEQLQCYVKLSHSIEVFVGTSYISHKFSYKHATQYHSFNSAVNSSVSQWNSALSKFQVTHSNITQIKTFYSTLYRLLLFPHNITEFNSYRSPVNFKIYKGKMFTDIGFWDVFRAAHPFLTLFFPEVSNGLVKGTLNVFKQSKHLPQWFSPGHRNCMVGNHANCIIADCIIKGNCSINYKQALEAMINDQIEVKSNEAIGRNGVEHYNKYGYVESSIDGSSSKTLDYSYNDFCIAQVAKILNNQTIYQQYIQKATNYYTLFDSNHFFKGKDKFGVFDSFDQYRWGNPFVEGNALHYKFSVLHDIQGIINMYKDKEEFAEQIDELFNLQSIIKVGSYNYVIHEMVEMKKLNLGQYAHGNQPIQHVLYLYPFVGQSFKAEEKIRLVMNNAYSYLQNGYCGDEDNGQTSAWYVLSALGFYSVTPGVPEYVIGVPLFDKIELKLNGSITTIQTINNGYHNCYVQQVFVNDNRYTKVYFDHSLLTSGVNITFVLGDKPKFRKHLHSDLPFSLSPPINRKHMGMLDKLIQ
ncbi:hypothetical protein QTN25_009796 [Entamoeba marina]